jgi:hypothetical protein
MADWSSKGCDECRRGILSGRSDLPERVATSIEAHAHLLHCNICGSWWEESEREAHVVSEAKAKRTFPHYFAG